VVMRVRVTAMRVAVVPGMLVVGAHVPV